MTKMIETCDYIAVSARGVVQLSHVRPWTYASRKPLQAGDSAPATGGDWTTDSARYCALPVPVWLMVARCMCLDVTARPAAPRASHFRTTDLRAPGTHTADAALLTPNLTGTSLP